MLLENINITQAKVVFRMILWSEYKVENAKRQKTAHIKKNRVVKGSLFPVFKIVSNWE